MILAVIACTILKNLIPLNQAYRHTDCHREYCLSAVQTRCFTAGNMQMDPLVQLATYSGLDERIVILWAADEVDAVFIRTESFNVLVDTLATPALCGRALERLRQSAARQILDAKRQEQRFQDVEISGPTMTFAGETMTINAGDLTLDLIHTPGHAPDHVGVWIMIRP